MKKALLFGALTALLLGCNNAPTQKSNKDNEAYEACSSISDYRAYMRTYGTNGLHYKEAKNAVDRYVADSITKAEAREKANKRAEAEEKEDELYLNCTTIAACDKYLKEYPNGRYVYEVKEMKAELEKAEKGKKTNVNSDKQEEEAYKKCTTVAACNSYLKAYPNGKYAGVVNKKKIELEKKEAEAKKDSSKPTTTKKQETNPNNNNTTQPKKTQKKDDKQNERPKAKKIEKKK